MNDTPDLPPTGPLLALDPGEKTIGVAVCNGDRTVITPVETIRRTKFTADAMRVFELFDEFSCVGLVIGLPINMDGSIGPRAQSARALGNNLKRLRDLPIRFQDERLSSDKAEDRLRAAGKRREEIERVIDAHAAAVILEDAIGALTA
ncbi:Holliday junction resolvase RuvX [Hyphobacterium sp. CCMP332]|uniref:Holliday junction resolvase RuvX n=1 Tax=Hyphobacterium sp. CCMP332 TaxID=2749086 RepID=UPI0016504BAF|nr:Holliday junction resolvase RuvX [Hyphobacterium sp. CCMP332]QNL18892.1 Holliday junction resolvase RuvX [Hyphobacterium sp. CCMP332]